MDPLGNEWQLTGSSGCSGPAGSLDALLRRAQRAEAEFARLESQLKSKERQVTELQMALAHSTARHYAVEDRLERELECLRAMVPPGGWIDRFTGTAQRPWGDGLRDPEGGVIIHLPYVTAVLSVLFDAIYLFWKDYDADNPPKSSTVARAIDERLDFRAQSNGEASRSGQAYASAIRPDCIKEADNRHHVHRRV
ncbi:hypothetical protein [Caballeronia mineralivorans]|jgi:hypothetical protein|uniref:hypothetical protein n=1 Tax=Caballeronia mineralivorans TaxID=2010198 RepID=UPI0023F1E88A|nr:hypothetical protein [Caballeronia mineralivorans]MDB5782243.1 hypothetical protein [Caballeronia mineralivorans]